MNSAVSRLQIALGEPAVDRPSDARGPSDRSDSYSPDDLFHRYTMAELLAADRTFRWTIRGLLVTPTYGMIAGDKKTLKTMFSTFLDLAIATGVPLFDQFTVDNPGPVVMYVGEGGQIPAIRRVERVARAMGITPADADYHHTFDIAPITSERFRDTLRRDLDQLQPALVHIDPLYAFHGAATNAANLHEEGALLAGLSAPITAAGSNLLINNHFSKSGRHGRDLAAITMAGGGEWVDTWILLSHREDPQVDIGQFQLLMEIGSRQWGGNTWELDLDVGRFDVETGDFDGQITWDIRRHSTTTTTQTKNDAKTDRITKTLYSILLDNPAEMTKTDILKLAGGNAEATRGVFEDLAAKKLIAFITAQKPGSPSKSTRPLWYVHEADRPEGTD